jgi:hypothetical protein
MTRSVTYASAGPAEPGGAPVYVLETARSAEVELAPGAEGEPGVGLLDPRTDLANHSPSGFSWGYSGSGPAQLALAVLAHAASEETALRRYQDFKEEVVAQADPDEPFVTTTGRVAAALGGDD